MTLLMENESLRPPSSRQKERGYEPSDTESDVSPWHSGLLVSDRASRTAADHAKRSPLKADQKHTFGHLSKSTTHQTPRRLGSSPHMLSRDRGNGVMKSPRARSTSPFGIPRYYHRHVSPYKARGENPHRENNEFYDAVRMQNRRPSFESHNSMNRDLVELQRDFQMDQRLNHRYCRSQSVQSTRGRETKQHIDSISRMHGRDRSQTLSSRPIISGKRSEIDERYTPAVEVNEMLANMKLSRAPTADGLLLQSTESISAGDIFFSRDHRMLTKSSFPESGCENNLAAKEVTSSKHTSTISHSTMQPNSETCSNSVATRPPIVGSNNSSSKWVDNSGKLSGALKKLAINRQQSQTNACFSCVRQRIWGKPKSPVYRSTAETNFIEKSFVAEELRQFWADKHRPWSLSEFLCHKKEAQRLKQLITRNNFPHILFKGPSGSGKKSLCMAMLHEIFGDSVLEVSHVLRCFQVKDKPNFFNHKDKEMTACMYALTMLQETKGGRFSIPVASSSHHMEINLKYEAEKCKYALIALVKEMVGDQAVGEVSDASFKADFKVIVLHEADKVSENVQHLIKWIMDCYMDVCKIILCCEDDAYMLDSVKKRCKIITVDAPAAREIMDVLIQIAKREKFDLPVSFAARVASNAKHNLREAIMALEACKAHNYPFVDEQPIPLGWEDALVELAAEILADPSPKRLSITRGVVQKLLVEFVHPKLILLKLAEQFLRGIDPSMKRELYYWHAYYDKRLPEGKSALLKLEEFVAKFMSIYRRRLL